MSIEPVDLEEFASTASAILRDAWKPPCLDYSPEYLKWQCGFPSDLKPISLAAFQDGKPVAFVAATGRNTNAGPCYMSSFMSLLPGTPSSVAIGLVRYQSRALRNSGALTVVFAQAGSVGEQLLAVGDTVGLKRFPLGDYRIHAAAPRKEPADVAVTAVTSAEWLDAWNALSAGAALSLVFDAATLRHLEADPFRREFLVAEKGGARVGAAMLSETRSVTVNGLQSTPTLHSVRLRDNDADALSALLLYARGRGAVVNVPNVTAISVDVRRAAGLRATPSAFVGYAVTDGRECEFTCTDMEIV